MTWKVKMARQEKGEAADGRSKRQRRCRSTSRSTFQIEVGGRTVIKSTRLANNYEFKVSCETAPKGQGFFAENP